ncbi:uncharacterized protein [Littorina saxatilis]
MSDSFAGWEGVHLLVDGSSCGPAVKWNNSVQCSQYEASGPVSTYTYKFTVDSTRHRGAGLRCVVGCTHNPRRHKDVTIAYDTCNPLKISGTPMDDHVDDDDNEDDLDDDDNEDDLDNHHKDSNNSKDNKGIPPGDNNKKSGASKAGIIIGSIVGVIVFIGLVGFLISRKNRRAESPERGKSCEAKAVPGSSKNEEKPHAIEIDKHGTPSQKEENNEEVKKPGKHPEEAHEVTTHGKHPEESNEEVSKSGEHPGESKEIPSQHSESDD